MFAPLIHSVHVSRPVFWFICVWLYLIVVGGHFQASLLSSLNFWIGLFYCTYPLNLLVYSWNDLGDTALDSKNPRKGWYLVGTKTKEERLQQIFLAALALNLIFCIVFVIVCGCAIKDIGIFLVMTCALNWMYNNGPKLRSGPPPLDLIGPCGYLLVLHLSCSLNGFETAPIGTYVFHFFMVQRSQLWGQIIDRDVDEQCGRRTTAVSLGVDGSRLLLSLLLIMELTMGIALIPDMAVWAFSALSLVQSLVELFFYPKTMELRFFVLTGVVLTSSASVLLLRVCYSGAFSAGMA